MTSRFGAHAALRRRGAFFGLCACAGVLLNVSGAAHAQSGAAGGCKPATGIGALLAKIPGLGSECEEDPRTRFIVALDKPAKFQVYALPNPNRVVIDMPLVNMRLPAVPARPVGVINAFRGGKASASRSRVVIDVTEPVVVENAVIRDAASGGSELVLDIVPVRSKRGSQIAASTTKLRSGSMGLGLAGLQPPLPRQAQNPKELADQAFKPLIVLDPGHGGHDSGARKFGVQEKDVVLKFALKLRQKLIETGRYRVQMTRDRDAFVPLGDRRAFAEDRTAALFISIHADYASSKARGATIYSLRETVAERLKSSASKSVQDTVLTDDEQSKIAKAATSKSDLAIIRKILAEFAVRDVEANSERTSTFTDTVIKHMSASTNMRPNPDREAAFKVLKTAKVPAVLIELAFVSNRQDAKLLTSVRWRERVSSSIVEAVDRYFSETIARLPL